MYSKIALLQGLLVMVVLISSMGEARKLVEVATKKNNVDDGASTDCIIPGLPCIPGVPLPNIPGLPPFPTIPLPPFPNIPGLPPFPTIPIPTIPGVPTIPGIPIPGVPTIPGIPIPGVPLLPTPPSNSPPTPIAS